MKFKVKGPFNKKKMSENKHVVNEPNENEEVTASGEPFSPEIMDENTLDAEVSGESESEKLHAEMAETRDKFLRIYSEFDNYKKRTQRERLELLKSAGSEIIISLLPVLDDMERALKSAEVIDSANTLKSGLELITNKLKNTLEQKGLKRMNSIGEEFDVDLHEAITNVPVQDEKLKGRVVDEAESGYFLNDKVIRHAKVIIGI